MESSKRIDYSTYVHVLKLPPVLTTVCILRSCTLVHFNPPWNPSHCRKDSEGRKILLQNNPLLGNHSLGPCAKQHWKDLVRVGRWWRRWCAVHCHLWLASRFFMTELWSNVTERYKPKLIESWQKELTKRHVLPAPKESLFFCVPLATYTQDSLYSYCINEFYLHLLKMLAYFTY